MKYDDASWHFEGDFPEHLPPAAGATHIAMFVAWAALNGLASGLHQTEFPDDLDQLKSQTLTPVEWLFDACDGRFTDEDLTAEGNRFARAYYGDETGLHTKPASYMEDYGAAFPDAETLYAVEDGWTTYAILEPVIRRRFEAWRAGR